MNMFKLMRCCYIPCYKSENQQNILQKRKCMKVGSNASSEIILPNYLSFWRHFVLKNLRNHSNWWVKRGVFCSCTFQKWLVRCTMWPTLWWIHNGYLYYLYRRLQKYNISSQTSVIDIKTTALKMQLNGIGLLHWKWWEHWSNFI